MSQISKSTSCESASLRLFILAGTGALLYFLPSASKGRSKCQMKVKSSKSRIAHRNAKIVKCSLLIYFFSPLSKCSEKWKERSRCWESAPSPKPLTPMPISWQPLGRFQRKLNPLLQEDHPSSTRTIPGGCRDMGDRGWGRGDDNDNNKWIRSCGGIMYLCIVPYIKYFVQTRKWPGCENLLKDFIRKMAWEKRFGYKMKSKPTTLILGSCVSKRAKIPCHILRFVLRDLPLFTFIWHLDRP